MKLKWNGLIGTIITHGLILALLILGSLTFPDPPPEEEGILVNFGIDDTGYGLVEPKGDEANQGNDEPDMAESIPEEVAPTTTPDPVVEETTPADNTQDVEEVIVKEDPKPSAEDIRKQQEEVIRIQKQKEETERIKKEQEEERIRIAEEERIRKEKEAEQRKLDAKADRLNNMGKNTFGKQGVGEADGSQGIKPGTGTNQGVTTGSPGADKYGDGAGLGDNQNYGLGSRKAIGNLPKPNVDDCSVTSRIVITVEIQVDKQGNVVSATVSKSTFSDNCINNVVLAAARSTKFSTDPNAAIRQKGWIRYTIEP